MRTFRAVEARGSLGAELERLVTLAEGVEHASCAGVPLLPLLDGLDEQTDRSWRRIVAGQQTVDPGCVERWRGVVASVRRDVERGGVRSVTGIAREARRLALQLELQLEPRTPFVTSS